MIFKWSVLCVAHRGVAYYYLLAKIGFDPTESEPCKVCPFSSCGEQPECMDLRSQWPSWRRARRYGSLLSCCGPPGQRCVAAFRILSPSRTTKKNVLQIVRAARALLLLYCSIALPFYCKMFLAARAYFFHVPFLSISSSKKTLFPTSITCKNRRRCTRERASQSLGVIQFS